MRIGGGGGTPSPNPLLHSHFLLCTYEICICCVCAAALVVPIIRRFAHSDASTAAAAAVAANGMVWCGGSWLAISVNMCIVSIYERTLACQSAVKQRPANGVSSLQLNITKKKNTSEIVWITYPAVRRSPTVRSALSAGQSVPSAELGSPSRGTAPSA